jgi:transcriptional regulator with XRE-family HTH domain
MAEVEKTIELNIKKVAERVKQLRFESGYSSYETFAFDKDINRVQYWRVEKGHNITLKTFFKILQIHNLTPEEFFKDFS